MAQQPAWSLLPEELWLRAICLSSPPLKDGREVDPHACLLHLRTLAMLQCTGKVFRRLVLSPEAELAWSQVAVVRHFEWRCWRPFTSVNCCALIRWLQPRARLITHLHLDYHMTHEGRVEDTFLESLTALQSLAVTRVLNDTDAFVLPTCLQTNAAPLVHLSCQGRPPATLPCSGLTCLTLTLPEKGCIGHDSLCKLLPSLPLLQQLVLHNPQVSWLGDVSWFVARLVDLPAPLHSLTQLSASLSCTCQDDAGDGPPLYQLARECVLTRMELADKLDRLPCLARFSLELFIAVEVEVEVFSDEYMQVASLNAVSLVQWQGSGATRLVKQFQTARDLDVFGEWECRQDTEAWDETAARLEKDGYPLDLACPLEVFTGVQRFKADKGL